MKTVSASATRSLSSGLSHGKIAGSRRSFFEVDCFREDRRNPLCRGKSGLLTILVFEPVRGSSAAFDVDDDGDLDIVTNEWSDHPQVLLSDLSVRKKIHFLKG
jgi:hypothetical protein